MPASISHFLAAMLLIFANRLLTLAMRQSLYKLLRDLMERIRINADTQQRPNALFVLQDISIPPMKLTTRSEYALLALTYLARHSNEGYISVESVAAAQDIPPKFLEQILLALKRAKFLRSVKGRHGGYRLAMPPNQITLAEIIRLFDGALAPTDSVSEYFYESTPIEKEKALIKIFKDIRDYVSNKLETTTIQDICSP